jgi:steroid 5-alpha reductase family enzyme
MPLDLGSQFAWAAAMMVVLFGLLWVVERIRRDASIVDVGWSAGLGILAVWFAATTPADTFRPWFVALLGAVWSMRLAGHLLIDRVIGKSEDGRYVRLRASWGSRAGLYFFLFFQAQSLLALLFVLPLAIAMRADRPLGDVYDLIASVIWLTSVLGETLADRQLAAFRADPSQRGKVCRVGLWRYSRHPNYFFEWLHWWTYVVLAIGHPWLAATLIGPALMLFFLLFVTGIRATEAHLLQSRGEAYRQYQRTTSPFIPWFPRKEAS